MSPNTPGDIDVTRPSPARVYDYLLGGKDNYSVDRQAAEHFLSEWPAIAANARANRAWMVRVVRFLAGEAGIDQFLDVGSGLPTADNLHQVAQRITPGARVVYVDNDPIVLAHGRAILEDNVGSRYFEGDAAEPDAIVDRAAEHLDMSRPVAVLLTSVLHYVPRDPAEVTGRLMERCAPGSYLAVAHITTEGASPELLERITEQFNGGLIPRPTPTIEGIFGGLELVPPGLVDVQDWRPDEPGERSELRLLGGVARKP
ncbi:SAM-dependent methyltransferase [Actinomadura bangladeshensis]|uniref:SAM-dependent methyltransferase n=1 Tax=Actinomadura bangladeshensis TaxID=453573 RepID=A0A6L9QAU8_9ACTN|nr:SAM-dependent methyltransferase [Actinomadura bangladeshensis]NEA22617.1 SAM-dependent methyltransferase [Actinomadura bangladeshensis]